MITRGAVAARERAAAGRRRLRQRGTAALEFAVVAPLLLLLVGGVADYGWAMWCSGALSNAVSQGAYYAFLTGANVSTSTVQSYVKSASGLSGVDVSVTPTTPAWECVASTNPTTLTAAPTATPPGSTACADGTLPGLYITIVASYQSQTFLPMFAAPTVRQSAEVRLQ